MARAVQPTARWARRGLVSKREALGSDRLDRLQRVRRLHRRRRSRPGRQV